MLRRIVGTVVGLVVAMAAIGAFELLGRQLFPPPPGTDMSDPAQIARVVERLSTGLKISVVFAWFAGTVAGGWAGLAVSRWRALPWIVAGGVILGAIANYVAIPHPLWMQAAGILLPIVGAWLVLHLTRR
jgi:hypothetical protein